MNKRTWQYDAIDNLVSRIITHVNFFSEIIEPYPRVVIKTEINHGQRSNNDQTGCYI